jgi:hypothetical protein
VGAQGTGKRWNFVNCDKSLYFKGEKASVLKLRVDIDADHTHTI